MPDDRRRCAAELGQCEQILAEIIEQEKQSEHVLVKRRDEVVVQLQGVHMAGLLPQRLTCNFRRCRRAKSI